MSGRDPGPDEVRPIPQGHGSAGWSAGPVQWPEDPADDAYVVDTRRRLRRPDPRPRTRQPDPRTGRRVDEAPVRGGGDGRGPTWGEAPDGPAPAPAPRRRRRRGRAAVLLVLLVVLAWVAFMVWVPVNAWNNVSREDNTPAGPRPADTSGYNYLLVGSDSREGLTAAQQQELNASGGDIGKRTDSIILVHVPQNGGKSSLISIPRDSYVPIPGKGSNKINASYAFGGSKLLTNTVEQATGIHIDGYVEIGFGGFAAVVDSLGGVDVCVPFDMKDEFANIDLKKGCQTLDGPTALGYVRARHSDPRGDIGRAERQRQFLGAVMKKALQPSTVLIPWRYKAFADASAQGLVVGQDTSLTDATRVLQALRGVDSGDTLSLVVPIESANYQTPNAGVAVKWDSKQALALFQMIKSDEPMSLPPAGTQPK